MWWVRHVARMVEIRNSSRILDGKSPGKQLFGRQKRLEVII
jgi:hypothetical protein